MRGAFVMCDVHGLVESNSAVGMENNSRQNTISGSWFCPLCGRTAPLVDGTYSVQNNQITAVLRLTPAQINRLRTVANWAQQQAASPTFDEERVARSLERQIEKEAPQVARIVNAFRSPLSGNLAGWVGVLVAVIMWITSQNQISPDELERIIERAIETSQTQTSPVDPGVTPPLPAAPDNEPPPEPHGGR